MNVEFNVKVTELSGDRAQVEMVTLGDIGLREFRLTAEYRMWIYAKESGLPYEEALRKLCNGARTFKDNARTIKILPGKQP